MTSVKAWGELQEKKHCEQSWGEARTTQNDLFSNPCIGSSAVLPCGLCREGSPQLCLRRAGSTSPYCRTCYVQRWMNLGGCAHRTLSPLCSQPHSQDSRDCLKPRKNEHMGKKISLRTWHTFRIFISKQKLQ